MSRLPILAPALMLAACTSVPADGTAVPEGGECRNDGLAQFTGKQATAELGAEMLRVSGAKTLQWINPGTMVTMDFRSDRLRVNLDASGKVESARCG